MRQAGVLAAAGLVALEKMVDRLSEDHIRARRLAEGFANIPGVVLHMGMPDTNMVFLALDGSLPVDAAQMSARLARQDIRIGVVGTRQFRMVTHYWIDDKAIETVIRNFGQAVHSD